MKQWSNEDYLVNSMKLVEIHKRKQICRFQDKSKPATNTTSKVLIFLMHQELIKSVKKTLTHRKTLGQNSW